MKFFLLSLEMIGCALIVTGCSRSGSGSFTSEPFTQRSTTVPTIYTARLEPLNKNYVAGGVQVGEATVTVERDKVEIKLAAAALAPNMVHTAHIHHGASCPALDDDANKDGVLDATEGLPTYGFMLVNFGADISSLAASLKGGAPQADGDGVINYTGQGSYTSMLADLRDRPEMDPATGIGKLADGEQFKFEDSVVVVQGIPDSTELPSTTTGFKDSTAQASLPILCGRLQITVRPAPSGI